MMIRLQQLIAVIVAAGSAFAIISNSDDYFPFSTYPMYSRIFETSGVFVYRSVSGVTVSGVEENLNVRANLNPFWLASFREALLIEPTKPLVTEKLRATLAWYNRRQSESKQDSELAAIRLIRYDLPWSELTEAALRNQGLGNLLRTHGRLIYEVSK